jgi:NADP-dependent 3-hydroxy acid dehydrogenase YdfG
MPDATTTIGEGTFSRSSLAGKIAVVTGSTQGLGEATVRLFQQRGCKGVVVTGRNRQRGESLAEELTTSTCSPATGVCDTK